MKRISAGRPLNEILKMPIQELTDEEIVRAARKRLDADAAILIYKNKDGSFCWLGRWRSSEGRRFVKMIAERVK